MLCWWWLSVCLLFCGWCQRRNECRKCRERQPLQCVLTESLPRVVRIRIRRVAAYESTQGCVYQLGKKRFTHMRTYQCTVRGCTCHTTAAAATTFLLHHQLPNITTMTEMAHHHTTKSHHMTNSAYILIKI